MASGRLGSTVINPYYASLVYSNTSATPAAINVQATGLNTTANAKISYAIDSATVSLNQTTTATTISAGNVNYKLQWLDPISNTTPMRFNYINSSGSSGSYAGEYWDGSAWSTSGSDTSGNWLVPQKVDPYFYTNYSEYNSKTSPTLTIPLNYPSQVNYAYVNRYNLASGVTGSQFSRMLATASNSTGATAVSSVAVPYMGQGQDADLYTDFCVGVGQSSYMAVWVASAPGTYYTYSSNCIFYNFCGTNAIENYTQYWYAPRIMASNGFFVCQASGYSSSYFAICDQESATASGSPNMSFYWGNAASGAKWSGFNSSGAGYDICWFEWNPNTQKFYVGHIPNGSTFKIYSITKAQLRAVQNGSGSYVNFNSVATLESDSPAWGASYRTTRPLRIGQSLWQVQSNNGYTYVSTDLISWTLSQTYWASTGLPSITCFTPISSTSFLYATSGVANINRFASGFGSVSQNSLIENQTTFSNYQRTGLVLSAGDKLYAQNYGTTAFSITAMGYEG